MYSSPMPMPLGMPPPQMQQSMFGMQMPQNMFGFTGDINNKLLMAGLGMMSGRNPQQQFAGAMQGYGAGSEMDTAETERAEAKRKEEEQRVALDAVMSGGEFGDSLSPNVARLMAVNPELATSYISDRLKPQDAPDYPTSYDEYSLAQGNPDYAASLDNRARAGAPRSYGTPEPGTQLIFDDSGAPVSSEYIPGSAAERKAQAEATAAERAAQQEHGSATNVVETIDRASQMIQRDPSWTSGMGGAVMQNIPGTKANDVRALITTVKANAGFDRLQQMRDESPTGGALGQVSEMELQQLNSAIGNLEQSQTTDQLLRNLQIVREIYSAIIDGPQQGDVPQNTAPAGLQDLYQKYGLE